MKLKKKISIYLKSQKSIKRLLHNASVIYIFFESNKKYTQKK